MQRWSRTRRPITAAALPVPGAVRGAMPPDTLIVAQIAELTGSAAEAGDSWRSGVELAAQEINGAGGVLGKLLEIVTYDAQSNAYAARLAMEKALESDPLAVVGPAMAEPARGVLAVPRARGTPLILGADATEAAHPATFYTVPNNAAMMGRLSGWLADGAKASRIAILWSAREPYRAGRDALARAARERGIIVAADWVTESLTPAADIARLLTASPEMLVVLLPEEKSGRVIVEARRLAPRLPLLGQESLIGPAALAEAGAAVEGVTAHVLLPPEPDADAGFWGRYAAANRQPPDDLALAGYLAVGMVKAGLERAGTADARALADALRGLSSSVARQPMLGDCTWNAAGEPDRASWIVRIENGAAVKIKPLRG
jgi:branched-chain amino acid transport system substrate-binding protein